MEGGREGVLDALTKAATAKSIRRAGPRWDPPRPHAAPIAAIITVKLTWLIP